MLLVVFHFSCQREKKLKQRDAQIRRFDFRKEDKRSTDEETRLNDSTRRSAMRNERFVLLFRFDFRKERAFFDIVRHSIDRTKAQNRSLNDHDTDSKHFSRDPTTKRAKTRDLLRDEDQDRDNPVNK